MEKYVGLGELWTEEQKDFLSMHGITVTAGKFSWVRIEEGDYPNIKSEADRWDVMRGITLVFTASELNSARFLAMTGFYSVGYPMPDSDFGYKEEVYESKECPTCGIVENQTGPFSIVKPKTKRNAFSLEWVHDEIFVRREIYESKLRLLGVNSREVLIYPSRTVSDQFVQLDLSSSLVEINTEGLKFETCDTCKEKKYSAKLEDFLPPLLQEPEFEIGKSVQFFGSGHQAFRLNILSQKAKRVFTENRLALPRFFHPILNN